MGVLPRWHSPQKLQAVRPLGQPLPKPVCQQKVCDALYKGLRKGYDYESDRKHLNHFYKGSEINYMEG